MVFISFVAFCLNVENLGNSRTSSKSFSLPGLSFTAQWSGFGVIDVPVLFLRGLWLCRWLSSQSFLRWWDSRYSIKKLIPTKSHRAVLGTLTIIIEKRASASAVQLFASRSAYHQLSMCYFQSLRCFRENRSWVFDNNIKTSYEKIWEASISCAHQTLTKSNGRRVSTSGFSNGCFLNGWIYQPKLQADDAILSHQAWYYHSIVESSKVSRFNHVYYQFCQESTFPPKESFI